MAVGKEHVGSASVLIFGQGEAFRHQQLRSHDGGGGIEVDRLRQLVGRRQLAQTAVNGISIGGNAGIAISTEANVVAVIDFAIHLFLRRTLEKTLQCVVRLDMSVIPLPAVAPEIVVPGLGQQCGLPEVTVGGGLVIPQGGRKPITVAVAIQYRIQSLLLEIAQAV
ncbi:hypothetical protein SDC9_174437 [bioreactor metagenome]|uniref:Uncharacterized protein n=1 Tax=bioreactor metagenome TaxID=1076179 RepID=A0A645GLH0_9ZZZZ